VPDDDGEAFVSGHAEREQQFADPVSDHQRGDARFATKSDETARQGDGPAACGQAVADDPSVGGFDGEVDRERLNLSAAGKPKLSARRLSSFTRGDGFTHRSRTFRRRPLKSPRRT
jgi:hypothetical protein